MRRSLAATALAVAVCVFASACGNPGIDGRLADDWGALPEPKPFVPSAGVCHLTNFNEAPPLLTVNPLDCTILHKLETTHVGTFTAAAANRVSPPPRGSSEMRAAYAECDARTSEYVGGEWRDGRLWLGVALPTADAWNGGARWFRCDVSEMSTVESEGAVNARTASLKGALAAPSPLRLGCYATKLDKKQNIDTMTGVDCAKSHNSEYVGVWRAPDVTYPDRPGEWERFYTGCYEKVAKYVGVPNDRNIRFRTGVVTLPSGADGWKAGDRGVRCYLWISDAKFNRSLKGTGNAGLPVR